MRRVTDPLVCTVVVMLGDQEVSRTLTPAGAPRIVVQLDPIAVSRVIEERVADALMARLRERWRGVPA